MEYWSHGKNISGVVDFIFNDVDTMWERPPRWDVVLVLVLDPIHRALPTPLFDYEAENEND